MEPHRTIIDDLDQLLAVLPDRLKDQIRALPDCDDIIEIVLDLGRVPEVCWPGRFVSLGDEVVTAADLDTVVGRLGTFGDDNRAGIERTLHRISALRNREGRVVGLTCRVGRAVMGTVDIIRDVVEAGASMLLLGRPGVGKTTLLRDVARVLAEDMRRRVVIVDTSNEIAGDGDIPHPAIGRARRMQVPTVQRQAAVMIEAVENHMPEVVVIDEIGTQAEAEAARTIAERGVQLVATAHGSSLQNLILNPALADLVGGIQAVTLGDEEARRRGTRKTVLERKAPPTFPVLVEIQSWDRMLLHRDVASTVDRLLRDKPVTPEVRQRDADGRVVVLQPEPVAPVGGESGQHDWALPEDTFVRDELPESGGIRIFPYGVSKPRLERSLQEAGLPAVLVKSVREASLVLTLKSQYRKMPRFLREAESMGMPIHVLRSNTQAQIDLFVESLKESSALRGVGGQPASSDWGGFIVPKRRGGMDEEEAALLEVDAAAARVHQSAVQVELTPRNPYLRRLQHERAKRLHLLSRSIGREPHRRVVVFPKPGVNGLERYGEI